MSFVSCDIYKKSSKEKKDIDFSENVETRTYRQGDTVSFNKLNIKVKDTTIYTYNRQGTTLKTIYKDGQVQQVDCYSSKIETLILETRKLLDNSKVKESEKKEEVNTTIFLYMFGAIIIIICFGFFLMFMYLKSNTKTMTTILESIVSKQA